MRWSLPYLCLGFICFIPQAWSDLPPLAESEAYHAYIKRPRNEVSRLAFLIDRLKDQDMVIHYDRWKVPTKKAAPIARWYLNTFYKGQTAEEWVYEWCDTTVPQGKPIYVQYGSGKFQMGSELLIEELQALEKLTNNL